MSEALNVYPRDEHNATLVGNVHPADWVNPEPAPRYHLVVVGAGTGGLVTAVGAASLGARVALVERELLGGDCLNVGCVPSKSLIRSARVMGELAGAAEYGVHGAGEARADFAGVMARMRRLRAHISHHDSVRRMASLGIDVFLGDGRFTDGQTLEVDGRRLRFSKAVIATGARAAVPPVPGLAEAGYLTNATVFNLTERPGHLLVLGGGPIGSELAQAFRRLGSAVTVVAKDPHFLPLEDDDAARILHERFRAEGVDFHFGATLDRVETRDGRKTAYVAQEGAEPFPVPFDALLVGAGRAANVEGLGLEAAGVEYAPRRGVRVDARLRSTNRRIYAVGDACLPYKFTHMADFTARIAIQNALFRGRKKWTDLVVPWCTYTDPEIAHVGLYEHQARERGIAVETFVRHLGEVDRALLDGEAEGFVKVHVRRGTDRIVGATVVARHAGEMISEITLAMTGGVGLKTLANTIHPYPTQAEAIRQVGDAYNRTRLTPRAQRVLAFLIRLFN